MVASLHSDVHYNPSSNSSYSHAGEDHYFSTVPLSHSPSRDQFQEDRMISHHHGHSPHRHHNHHHPYTQPTSHSYSQAKLSAAATRHLSHPLHVSSGHNLENEYHDQQEIDHVHHDTFQADAGVSLMMNSHDIADSSKMQRSSPRASAVKKSTSPPVSPGRGGGQEEEEGDVVLPHSGSFGNGSCISSLSADETHYDRDDKTVKSLDASLSHYQQDTKQYPHDRVNEPKGGGGKDPIQDKSRIHRRSTSVSRGESTSGKDFAGAFDHLDHLIDPKDLLDDDNDVVDMGDETHHEQPFSWPLPVSVQEDNGDGLPIRYPDQRRQQQHHRSMTCANPRLLTERPKPLQQRAASDYLTLSQQSRPVPSQLQRATSIGSRTAVSSSHLSSSQHQYHHRRSSSSQPVAAHATLRECICKSKASTIGEPIVHKRLVSSAPMPQILTTRSTSLTVQSSTANTVSSSWGFLDASGLQTTGGGGPARQGGGVVWNGQPIANLTVPPPSPCRSSRTHSRNSSSYTVSGGGIYGTDATMDPTMSQMGHVSRHSAGSGTSFLSQDMYSGCHTNSIASSLGNVHSTTSDGKSTIVGSALGHHPHHRMSSDDGGSTLVKELQATFLVDDKTAVSSGMESGSFTSPSSRRRKPSLKDEMKFILKKMVPTPLRKVTVRRNKVNLERSSGCLT